MRTDEVNRFEKIEYDLIISFAGLLAFFLLYILRFLDDNTLTSWKWIFRDIHIGKTVLFLCVVLICAFFISKVSVAEKYFVPILLLLSFGFIPPLWMEPEVFPDAARYFVQAKSLKLYGIGYFFREWGRDINAWTDLPVVPFIYGLLFNYCGEARVCIQFFNTTVFSLSVLVTFFLGKELWDGETGFYAGLFLMSIPYLLIQAPLMMVDVPTMFFMTLTVYTYLKAIKKGGLLIGIAPVIIALTLLSKYSTWVMSPILPLITSVYAKSLPKETLRRSVITVFLAGSMCVLFIGCKFDVFQGQIEILRSYQWPALGKWKEGFISNFFFQSHPFLILFTLYGAYRAVKEKDRRFLIPLWFAFFVLTLRANRIRYIIPLFPLFALTASYGLRGFGSDEAKRFTAYGSIGFSLLLVFGGFLPFLEGTSMGNLRLAGKFIDGLDYPSVLVRTLPQRVSSGNTDITVPILDLYTDKTITHNQGSFKLKDYERIKKSPLRFTWEFGSPAFYRDNQAVGESPVVLISGTKAEETGPGFSFPPESEFNLLKSFEASSGVFRYKSFVYVFAKRPWPLSFSGQ